MHGNTLSLRVWGDPALHCETRLLWPDGVGPKPIRVRTESPNGPSEGSEIGGPLRTAGGSRVTLGW